MRVWLVCIGEPLPIDKGNERQLRTSLFAATLADLGHDVLWWASTFDHNQKRQRFERDELIQIHPRISLQLLHARPYEFNISLSRLINHRQLGRAFRRLAGATAAQARPDVILASMPTVDLAAAATEFGKRHDIPVVVDVRDLHPDIYLSLVPKPARPFARIALAPLYRDLRIALRLASGTMGIAPSFLEWASRHAAPHTTRSSAVFPLSYPELNASPEELHTAARTQAAAGVRVDRKIVWYVGTFNRWIDLRTPIEAARLLANAGRTDVQFVISGSGDFDGEWRRLAASLPNVVFTGWIGVPTISYLRSVAWAGLAPYRPGFLTVGNKLFEYIAGGLPILLSIGGDASSIIEEHGCGLVYEGGNPASLVKAIDAMSMDGVQQRMSANALRAHREHFASDKINRQMVEFVLGFASDRADAFS